MALGLLRSLVTMRPEIHRRIEQGLHFNRSPGRRTAMQIGRRVLLISGAAALVLVSGHRLAANEAETESWTPPDGALGRPGFRLWDPPLRRRAPLDASLVTNDGATSLRQLMAGRPAVLSFWSPSCAPCLVEKPSLDFLAGRLAEAGARVVVLSIFVPFGDRPTLRAAAATHQRLGLAHLRPIAEATRRSRFGSYIGVAPVPGLPRLPKGAFTLPCSTLVDPAGQELGRLVHGVPPPDVAMKMKGRQKFSAAEAASLPTRDLWRDDQMFEFLRALGA
jgi:thiol-disulfide isomerase/thioredoxin